MYVWEDYVARPPLLWMGAPWAEQIWRNPNLWTRTLRSGDHLAGYSDLRGNPLWLSAKLKATKSGENAPMPHSSLDWRLLSTASADAFSADGYRAGSLLPMASAATMSDVTPQKPGLLRLQRRLWHFIASRLAPNVGPIFVTTGPVFDPPSERLTHAWRVEVADAVYTIVVSTERKRAVAFIVPQNVQGDELIEHYRVTIDSIERRTGLDFFPKLDDAAERRMESELNEEWLPSTFGATGSEQGSHP